MPRHLNILGSWAGGKKNSGGVLERCAHSRRFVTHSSNQRVCHKYRAFKPSQVVCIIWWVTGIYNEAVICSPEGSLSTGCRRRAKHCCRQRNPSLSYSCNNPRHTRTLTISSSATKGSPGEHDFQGYTLRDCLCFQAAAEGPQRACPTFF